MAEKDKVIIVATDEVMLCPKCKSKLEMNSDKCLKCGSEIHFMNRVRNEDYRRCICQYNKQAELIGEFQNVYEIFYMESEKKKRDNIIKCCKRERKVSNGSQWRFKDDISNIDKLQAGWAAQEVLKVSLNGNIEENFISIKDAAKKLHISENTVSKSISLGKPPEGEYYFLFKKKEYDEKKLEDAQKNIKKIIQ